MIIRHWWDQRLVCIAWATYKCWLKVQDWERHISSHVKFIQQVFNNYLLCAKCWAAHQGFRRQLNKLPSLHVSSHSRGERNIILTNKEITSISAIFKRTRNKSLGMRNLRFNCRLGKSKWLPKQYSLLLLPLVASQRLKIKPYCWRHNTLQTQDSQDSSWIYSDSLPICVLAFTEPNIQCRLPRMDSPVQLWHNSTILNYNNGQHSKLSQRVP